MKDNQFDDLLKKRLKTYKSAVPADMWERITKDEREHKTGFFNHRYIGLLLVIFTGVATGLLVMYFTKNHPLDILTPKSNALITTGKKTNPLNNRSNTLIQPAPANLSIPAKAITVSMQEHTPIKHNRATFINGSIHTAASVFPASANANHQLPADNMLNDNGRFSNSFNNKTILAPEPASKSKQAAINKHPDSAAEEEETTSHDKCSIEWYASPGIAFGDFRSNNKTYQEVLKNSSRMQLSYTVGARLQYLLSPKLAMDIGLQYSRINEQVSIKEVATNYNVTVANKYTFVSVPLLLSYKPHWSDAVEVSVNAGVVVNIAAKYKGAIPAANGERIDLHSNPVYNNNVNANFYAGLNMAKNISGRTAVFAEPYFNYCPQNRVHYFYSFNRQIHTVGLSLGVRYHLYKKENE